MKPVTNIKTHAREKQISAARNVYIGFLNSTIATGIDSPKLAFDVSFYLEWEKHACKTFIQVDTGPLFLNAKDPKQGWGWKRTFFSTARDYQGR
jgi:hypothetical protein